MSFEGRQMQRYAGSLASRSHVLLRIGGREYPAVLNDESAGGFCVTVERKRLRLHPGKKIWLGTRATWHLVEVVHARRMKDGTKIGVKHVEDDTTPIVGAPFERSHGSTLLLVASLLIMCLVIFYQSEDPYTGTLHMWVNSLR